MKTCPRCGVTAHPEDKFCGECGYNLSFQPQSQTIYTQKELKVSDIRMNLAIIYLKQGKFGAAIQNLQKVLEDDPDNEAVHELLEQAKSAQVEAEC